MLNNSKTQYAAMRFFIAGLALIALASWFVATPSTEASQSSASAGPADPLLIEDLVAANRILYQLGLVDGFGHVSVRHNANPDRFLLSRSRAPNLVTADDILEYDLDANPIGADDARLYLERFIHSEIYRARPDVNAVVHNHSPGVIPFGTSSIPLQPIYHMAAFMGESVPIFDIRERFGITQLLVSDSMRGRALADALGSGPAVLMRGHGAVLVGPDVKFAVGRSYFLEVNARLQSQAIDLGGTVTYLNPGEIRSYGTEIEPVIGYDRPWELWKLEAMSQ